MEEEIRDQVAIDAAISLAASAATRLAPIARIGLLGELAVRCHHLHRDAEAEKLLCSASSALCELNDPVMRAAALLSLGGAYRSFGKDHDALPLLAQAVKTFSEPKYPLAPHGSLGLYGTVGLMYAGMQKRQLAMEAVDRILGLARESEAFISELGYGFVVRIYLRLNDLELAGRVLHQHLSTSAHRTMHFAALDLSTMRMSVQRV